MSDFNKSKYLHYIKDRISADVINEFDAICKTNKYCRKYFAKLFSQSRLPNNKYEDCCIFIEEYFRDGNESPSVANKYLFMYMGSVYLYCFALNDEEPYIDINSYYIRETIEILVELDDKDGAILFDKYLDSLLPSSDDTNYFLCLGRLFLYRAFPAIEIDLNKVYAILEELSEKLDSFEYNTDSEECTDAWFSLHKALETPEALSNMDIDAIMLPRS